MSAERTLSCIPVVLQAIRTELCQRRWFDGLEKDGGPTAPDLRNAMEHLDERELVGRQTYTFGMEFIKIVLTCIAASIVYGIVHDQFTARICVEYFTVFHPPVFATDSSTLLGIGWGIIATWWAGAIIGLLLAIAAREGSRVKLTAREIAPLSLLRQTAYRPLSPFRV